MTCVDFCQRADFEKTPKTVEKKSCRDGCMDTYDPRSKVDFSIYQIEKAKENPEATDSISQRIHH